MQIHEDLYIQGESSDSLKKAPFFEGPLSEEPIRLLIIMKEPHGDKLDGFWMRDEVLVEKKAKFYTLLGAFAKRILDAPTKEAALKKSAFINLYPFCGGASVKGGGYAAMMKLKRSEIDFSAEPCLLKAHGNYSPKEIFENRLQIIKGALDAEIPILAHTEIASKLQEFFGGKRGTYPSDGGYPCYHFENHPNWCIFSCPHPQQRSESYAIIGKRLGYDKPINEIE